MKQQSLFSWLQRSPENNLSPKPLSRDNSTNRQPLSPRSPAIVNAKPVLSDRPNTLKKAVRTASVEDDKMAVDPPVVVNSSPENVDPTPNENDQENMASPKEDSDSDVEEIKSPRGPLASLWNKSTKTVKPAVPLSVQDATPIFPVKLTIPPPREIKCPADFDATRIPDVLLVTEFLRNFGTLPLKKGTRHLDPAPNFHLLLNALGKPADSDPLYLCGILFHLVSFASKQTAFTKAKYLGEPLTEFDLSVQSAPEILRLFLTTLSPKSCVPFLSSELLTTWSDKGYFALTSNEKLDVLVATVNWLLSTPTVIDHLSKKEDSLHKLRCDLLSLRKRAKKDTASYKAALSEHIDDLLQHVDLGNSGNESEEEEKPPPRRGTIQSSKSAGASLGSPTRNLSKLNDEISELKLAVDKADQEFSQLRCLTPIGADREGVTYWLFPTFASSIHDMPVCVESPEKPSTWKYYTVDDLFKVISFMQSNPFVSDFNLRMALENIVKEAQSKKAAASDTDDEDGLEDDVNISAGIVDELSCNMLDSEARLYAAAFADPLADIDKWRERVKSPAPGEKEKTLAECLLAIANSVHLRVVVRRAKISPETEKKREESASNGETVDPPEENIHFFALDSHFAHWKNEVAKTTSASRLLVLFDVFLNWLNWSMSAEHARCKRCRRGPNHGALILCDKCNRSYHMRCLEPPMKEAPAGDWYCHECTRAAAAKAEVDDDDDDAEVASSDDGSAIEVQSESENEENLRDPDTECFECSDPATLVSELISCEICRHSFHLDCLDPPLRYPPRGAWYCAPCTAGKNKRKKTRRVICMSPPSPPPRPKVKAVKKKEAKVAETRRGTRSRDVPSRSSSRQTSSRSSNRSRSPPPQLAELSERYSFRPRGKRG